MTITHEWIFRIYSKVNQVIYSSIPIYSPGFKALASIAFEIFCWQDFIYIFSKGHNSGKGHNPDGKKTRVSYFFMKNPYMKFQNPSMHCSEVMLCIKKRNGRTDGRTHARTHVPEAICPSNSFEVGGIKMFWKVIYCNNLKNWYRQACAKCRPRLDSAECGIWLVYTICHLSSTTSAGSKIGCFKLWDKYG